MFCGRVAAPSLRRICCGGNSANPEPETFGRAFLDDAGCGVYAKGLLPESVASRDILQLTEGDMLGFVIAHELGHLLLGSKTPTPPTGVMQAHWTATTLHEAAHNTLFFTSAQAATLRSRLFPSLDGLGACLVLTSHPCRWKEFPLFPPLGGHNHHNDESFRLRSLRVFCPLTFFGNSPDSEK